MQNIKTCRSTLFGIISCNLVLSVLGFKVIKLPVIFSYPTYTLVSTLDTQLFEVSNVLLAV